MGREPEAREQRDALVGKTVFTADAQPLGTIAGVERDCLVIKGRGVARRVHVVPVAAIDRTVKNDLYLTRTMDDIVEQRPS